MEIKFRKDLNEIRSGAIIKRPGKKQTGNLFWTDRFPVVACAAVGGCFASVYFYCCCSLLAFIVEYFLWSLVRGEHMVKNVMPT